MRNQFIFLTAWLTISLSYAQGYDTMEEAMAAAGFTEENQKNYQIADALAKTILEELAGNSDFSGLWLSRDGKGNPIININRKKALPKSDTYDQMIKKYASAAVGVHVVNVDYSFEELEEVNLKVLDVMQQKIGVLMSGIGSKGKLEILVLQGTKAAVVKMFDAYSIPSNSYSIEEIPDFPRNFSEQVLVIDGASP